MPSAGTVSTDAAKSPNLPSESDAAGDTVVAALPDTEQPQVPVDGGAEQADPTPTTPDENAKSAEDEASDPGAPRFDVVRVDSDGQTVVAGTAKPNEEVEVLLDGKVVGTAVADDAGAFVTVIFATLSGDAQQLQLRVPAPNTQAAQSTSVALAPVTPVQPTAPSAGSDLVDQSGAASVAVSSSSPQVAALDNEAEAPRAVTPALTTDLRVGGSDTSEQGTPGATGGSTPESALPGTGVAAPDDAGAPTAPAPQDLATAETQTNEPVVNDSDPTAGTSTALAGTEAAAPLDDQAPAISTDLATLAPTQPDGGDASSSVVVRPSASVQATGGQISALSDSSGASIASGSLEVAPTVSRPAASQPETEQQFALSSPVIILPSAESGAAPTLVQPRAGGLEVLQSGGEVAGVTLDRISYTEGGDANITGRGEVGRAIRVYGNGVLLGSTEITGDGRWAMALQKDVVLDIKLFRFDELDASGAVTSRIETPFQYSSDRPQILKESEVVIQKGDYLWRIAEQYYGEGLRFSLIYGANAELIRDPDLIYPGQVFTVPELVDAN